jgi:ubiquinone/menaquinone biosynthesis C-methylase UbiE
MSDASEWRKFWETKSGRALSDFEFDRGTFPRGEEIENLSTQELLHFVEPKPCEVILDAGCGTGVNILLLHSRVKRVVGMDYSEGAMLRCKRKIRANGIENVGLAQGEVTRLPLPDSCVDKVLCMSVLHYLDDVEVRRSFKEFVRVLKDEGTLILHVKNISSLYLSTLWIAKRLKLLFGGKTKLEHFRSHHWYTKELELLGFEVLAYNSLNLFTIELMPRRLVLFFQKLVSFPY